MISPSLSFLAHAARGAVEVLPRGALDEALARGRPLRIKVGFDPTAPDLHLGHAVLLNALRRFQDAGHRVVLVIGDFTAQIGDPTGKNATRPPLGAEQVQANAATYTAQAFTVLDPAMTEVVFNSRWLGAMSAADLVRLAAQQTVARLLERDDFAQRFSAHTPIAVHEFLYPLLQGHDSVVVRADVEVGGTDQTFNLLMGRELQKQAGQVPQAVLTFPLLEGLDGVQKMSKSLGNHVGLTDPPVVMVTKIMTLRDEAVWRWFDLLSGEDQTTLAQWKADVTHGRLHPRDAKLRLARDIVARFHGPTAVDDAVAGWEAAVRRGDDVSALPVHELAVPSEGVPLPALLVQAGLAGSRMEARRKIQERAVRVGGEATEDAGRLMRPGFEGLLQIGKKRFLRVRLREIPQMVET